MQLRGDEMLRNENLALIRIWPSQFSSIHPDSWMSPGHVSLQTFIGGKDNTGIYVSYWPGSVEHPCCFHECGANHDHFHTLEQDTKYCGQVHIDDEVKLYHLNVPAINAHFAQRKQNGLTWAIRGSVFQLRNDSVANCVSLVQDCLTSGGFNWSEGKEDTYTVMKATLEIIYNSLRIKCLPVLIMNGLMDFIYNRLSWGPITLLNLLTGRTQVTSLVNNVRNFQNSIPSYNDLLSVNYLSIYSLFSVAKSPVKTLTNTYGFFNRNCLPVTPENIKAELKKSEDKYHCISMGSFSLL